MTKVRPLALFLLAQTLPLSAATVDQRLNRLESQVSEIQILIKELSLKPAAPASRRTPSSSGGYLVRSGDSFWSIAERYNISVSALERANPRVDAKRMQIGKTLNIPGQASSAQTPIANRSSTTATGSYRVQKGDILGHIAEAHGVRLHQLLSANPGLDPRRLRIGKVLRIPGGSSASVSVPPVIKDRPRPATPVVERVAVQPEREFKANRTSSSSTPERSVLDARTNPYHPEAGTGSRPEVRRLDNTVPSLSVASSKLVVVKENSRLLEIAKRYGTSVEAINRLNEVSLSPDQMIKAGSQLEIPFR